MMQLFIEIRFDRLEKQLTITSEIHILLSSFEAQFAKMAG